MHLTKQAQSRSPSSLRERDESPLDVTFTAEEVQRLTGGHRIGGLGPADLIRPRNAGLTIAQEHVMWREDVRRWQRDYESLLANVERLRTFLVRRINEIRQHAETVADAIAQNDAVAAQCGDAPDTRDGHIRLRRVHERMDNLHQRAVPKIYAIARAIEEAQWFAQ